MISGVLGKLPSRHDPRTLRMSKYLTGSVSPAPPERDWTNGLKRWQMYCNDQIGCCTIAAQGHLIQSWGAASGFPDAGLSEREVIDAYAAISGYVPGHPETDRGAVMLDALNHWRKVGVGGHKIHAYVKIDAGSRTHLMSAINLFGGVYLGCQLPLASRDRELWVAAPFSSYNGSWRAGTWGGHAVASPGYTASGIFIVTWGQLIHASWQWIIDYVDEAYAIIGPEWADEEKTSPGGFALNTLREDLAKIAG